MIELNKLNGKSVFVNPDLIRLLEAAGDTVLVFTDGETLIVRQSPSEVVTKIVEYRRRYSGLSLAPPLPVSEAADAKAESAFDLRLANR